MDNFYINSVFVVFIVTVNSVLATLVYRQSKYNINNLLFVWLSIAISLWVAVLYLETLFTSSLYIAKALVAIDFSLAAILAGIFLIFCLHFPQAKKLKKRYLSAMVPSVLFTALSFTSHIIQDVKVTSGEISLEEGGLYYLYVIYIGIYVFWGLSSLVKKLKILHGEQKLQTAYMLLGLGLSATFAVIFTLVLPRIIDPSISIFGMYGLVFFSILVTHAIFRFHLLDVKVIGVEILVGLLIFVFILDAVFSGGQQNLVVKTLILLFIIYGGYQLVQSVVEEVNKRKQLQELTAELKSANTRLAELDALKTEFVSMASHELLTPISAIQGYLHMILEEKIIPLTDPKAEEVLRKVHASSNRLARLVVDLLSVSRIEGGRIILEKQSFDLDEVIESTINELTVKAAEKNLGLESKKASVPQINTDKDKLKQVLTNLIGNAIKYTEKGKVVVTAEFVQDKKLGTKLEGTGDKATRIFTTGDFVVVHIQDTGIGIPKEEFKNIFNKFHRIGDWRTRNTQGTGLGLYISKNIVEIMGGQIWLESGTKKGSVFSFSIPVEKTKE